MNSLLVLTSVYFTPLLQVIHLVSTMPERQQAALAWPLQCNGIQHSNKIRCSVLPNQ